MNAKYPDSTLWRFFNFEIMEYVNRQNVSEAY